MSKSVQRLRAALADAGLPDTVVTLDDSARTADAAAGALGCCVGQIVKSLVFRDASDQPLLVLAAGDRRVDESSVAALHGGVVTLGDPAFVRAATGYAIGGVPPLGHVQDLPTVMDASLRRWSQVWAAAGTPHAVFSLAVADLARVTRSREADVG